MDKIEKGCLVDINKTIEDFRIIEWICASDINDTHEKIAKRSFQFCQKIYADIEKALPLELTFQPPSIVPLQDKPNKYSLDKIKGVIEGRNSMLSDTKQAIKKLLLEKEI